MATKKKPLTPAQRVECMQLREIWDKKHPGSQAKFGEQYEIGDQGLVTQYLNGHIPLNLEVAIKFARGLGVSVGDFAQRFEGVLAMVPGYKEFDPDVRLVRDEIELELLKLYRAMSGKYRQALIVDAHKYADLMKSDLEAPARQNGRKRKPATVSR